MLAADGCELHAAQRNLEWRMAHLSPISAVEKAGFSLLAEGAKVSYEIIADRGKQSAAN